MTRGCPEPSAWVDLAWGAGQGSPELLAHAEACAACRAELAGAMAAREAAPRELSVRRRAWMPLAAAAGLALAATAAWKLLPAGGTLPENTPGPVAAPTSPFAEDKGLRRILAGPSGTVTLAEAARAKVQDGRVLLESGLLRLESGGGELEARWPGGRLLLAPGSEALVVRLQVTGSAWVREAFADTDTTRVRLIRGKGSLEQAGRPAEDLLPRPVDASWTWELPEPAWVQGQGIPARLQDRILAPFGNPSGDGRWEAVFRRLTPEATVAVRFRAGGQGWELPFGSRLAGEPGRPVRVAVERRAGWVRIEAAGRELAHCRDAELARLVQPCPQAADGIRAWGGDVEVVEARCR